ncbi:MAG TPA: endonuclease [Actinobacteria bacterium]|nr:endonuclease [Actinomycetota bacterium]
MILGLVAGLIAALLPATLAAGSGPIYLNEIQVSTASTDWEFVEVQGTPGTSLTGYTLVGIESDSGISRGSIDRAIALTGSIPADGFWVAISPAGATAYGVTGDAAIADNTFENGSAAYFLVTGFSGSVGTDLDGNDDGVFDAAPPWTAEADSLSLRDSLSDPTFGAAASFGLDGTFFPSGVFRCPNAPTGDWSTSFLNFSTPDGTPGVANCAASFPVPRLISEIQGPGTTSPFVATLVEVTAVVVGDFQGNAFAGTQLNGFFLQEEAGDDDGDPATSEGIFVFAPGAVAVDPGDTVTVTGRVVEFDGMTELTDVTEVVNHGPADPADIPAATLVAMPVTAQSDWEKYEGMLIAFEQDLYISEYFNFDRFGEIVITTARQYQPSQVFEPGSPDAFALATANALARITLDDGRTSQNPDPAIHPNGLEFTLTNTFRGGDILQDVTGVLAQAFGLYRIHPTQGATHIVANPRPTKPDLGQGHLRVASFNVLNFFTHLDLGPDVCGPTGVFECRGADTAAEYKRQLDKLVAGIIALDADIVGIQEIENDVRADDGNRAHDAVITLVEALNAADGRGTWAWVGEATALGGATAYNDYPVRNEIIYRVRTVTPVGAPVALRDARFDAFRPGTNEPMGRPPLAQTFTLDSDRSDRGNRRAFTVVVNHFKSKGSSCGAADPFDPHQAQCNLTRVAQSKALLEFADWLQTNSRDEDVLIIGDLNSYAMEDPMDTLEAGGFTDLLQLFEGPLAYGYVFDGQLGSLDQALASSSLLSQVLEATSFHINADEPDILDYDMSFKLPAQDALYEPLPYRVSDHDPLIVRIKLVRQDR